MQHELTSFADVHRLLADWPVSTKRHLHSLDHMHELLAALGNPHRKLRVIHVAGTSGKTSTAYYVAALLQQAGKRVGLTVSPHVDEVNERVQLDLTPLAEDYFVRRLQEYLALIEPSGVVPNYFELFMTFALWEFAAKQVDYAVVEVGIGGLLDSTNVFDDPAKVCVITDIGFDHTNILGSTLAEITAHKAGIIHLHNPVFTYNQDRTVVDGIRGVVKQKQADLHLLSQVDQASELDFLPQFQQRNFGLARSVVEYVLERDDLPRLTHRHMLAAAKTYIPARMEVRDLGGRILILDAAHNAQKIETLLQSIQARYPDRPTAMLLRLSSGKVRHGDGAGGLEAVLKGVHHLVITNLAEESDGAEEHFDPERMAAICHTAGYKSFEIVPDPVEAFRTLCARPEELLVVAGSFRLLNYIRPLVVNSGAGRPS